MWFHSVYSQMYGVVVNAFIMFPKLGKKSPRNKGKCT